MIRIFNESAYKCKVIRFRFGSIIAEYQLLMDPNDPRVDEEYVTDTIENAINEESLDYITPAKDSLIVEGTYKRPEGIVL